MEFNVVSCKKKSEGLTLKTVEFSPKEKPYAEEPWTDGAAFIGPGQDKEARYVNDKENASMAKNLSGGWMDAGDYNKYVTFAGSAVHMLLTAYEQNPKIFSDDFNIPESGNGIPDLIDEVKYELDWIKKMQHLYAIIG